MNNLKICWIGLVYWDNEYP